MKTYTRKQVTEAIAYWEGVLRRMDEGANEFVEPGGGAEFAVADLLRTAERAAATGHGRDTVCALISPDGTDPASERNSVGGYVNGVSCAGGRCEMTLSPYRNGGRSRDLSVGPSAPPMDVEEFARSLRADADPSARAVVRMKDPYGFGPKAGRTVVAPVFAAKITNGSYSGVFLLVDTSAAVAG